MKKSDTLQECLSHYRQWDNDITQRMTRKFGWNDVTDAYYGRLPDDWPFESRTVDPRIRTNLIEKNSRLTGGRITGRVLPVENGDNIKARMIQALIDYQWRMATDGGTMQTKIGVSDIDTRLYNSKFCLVEWRVVKNSDGTIKYEGNELKPLDIRDCGMDAAASHIRDAKWFQHRQWVYLDDMERAVDSDGKPLFKNLAYIRKRIEDDISDTRTEYTPHLMSIQGREDHLGKDKAFPMIKIVTEYREDRWITFSPTYEVEVRNIGNPYDHGKIPVVQLRYHPIQDDPLGENEVESVIPLWRAIQAVMCAYLDEVILKLRPPLKIIEGQARVETIFFEPEAQWMLSRPDAVTEYQSNYAAAIEYFQATYTSLVSALNTAMNTMSQGVSNLNGTQGDKTATEIASSTRQQNAIDQKNMSDLSEFIRDFVGMWIANNQQFLFSDPKKHYLIIKIIGKDKWNFFQKMGFDETYVPDEAQRTIADVMIQNPDTTASQLAQMYESAKMPRNPVVLNPQEKNPALYEMVPKMSVGKSGEEADLYIEKGDIEGMYDFIPDIQSLSITESEEKQIARNKAIQLLTTNGQVLQLLQEEGFRPKVKDLFVSQLEDIGLNDADRFFEKIENVQQPIPSQTIGLETGNQGGSKGGPPQGPSGATPVSGGAIQNIMPKGMAGVSQALPANQSQQPMA